jgi:hypothetical protein
LRCSSCVKHHESTDILVVLAVAATSLSHGSPRANLKMEAPGMFIRKQPLDDLSDDVALWEYGQKVGSSSRTGVG